SRFWPSRTDSVSESPRITTSATLSTVTHSIPPLTRLCLGTVALVGYLFRDWGAVSNNREGPMGSKISRLPSRFPVGTRYVIEGQGGRIQLRYLEFPDGRKVQLPTSRAASRPAVRRRQRQKATA